MKKILVVIIVLLGAWLTSVWFLGTKSEQSFKAFVASHSQQLELDLFRVELLSFRKTFMGATASIRIHSNLPFLNNKLDGVILDATSKNGPFFIDKFGVSIGAVRWIFTVNIDALSLEEREYLAVIFSKNLPKMGVRLGFDDVAYYALNEDVSSTNVLVNGTIDKNQNHTGIVTLNNFDVIFPWVELTGKTMQLDYVLNKEVDSSSKRLKLNFQIPSIKLSLSDKRGSFDYSLQGKGKLSSENNAINGFVDLNLKNASLEDLLVETVDVDMLFKEIFVDGIVRYSDVANTLDSLKQQAKWQLEESGEFPEGQDQVWQSYDQIGSLSQEILQVVNNEVFNADSIFQIKIKKQGSSGESILSGSLKPKNANNQKSNNSLLDSRRINTPPSVFKLLSSVLQGEAKVKLDEGMFQALSSVTPINKKEFRLVWSENKLLMK